MYLSVLCIFILKLEPIISIFPPHTDLQKVGEVIFNNEKYNVLKPTTHTISDYFKDYMLRRKNTKFPTKRLFIDDNGFRHYWSGFDKKTQSLRKTEILANSLQSTAKENDTDLSENLSVAQPNSDSENTNITETDKSNASESAENVSNKENSVETNNNKTVNNDDVSKSNESNELTSTTPEGDDIEVIKNNNTTENLRTAKDVKERTVAKTTFFCPFFGVITLSAFVD